MKNFKKNLSVSEKEFAALLKENNYACNAAGRQFIADRVKVTKPRQLPENIHEIIRYAAEVGGCFPKQVFPYANAQGGVSEARVCDLYDLPKDMVNPRLLYFSGCLTAPFYALEAIRFYAKQTGKLLESGSTGKEGNKGLFRNVYDRSEGLIIGTEYGANYRIMEHLAPSCYVRKHEREFLDTDTKENLLAQYQMALAEGLNEVTLVLVTGQPWYDKRLLAEWMYELRKEQYKDVKMNLVLAHCPLHLYGALPEAYPSEILLGYIAASLGPLTKDTVSLADEQGERYLMPGVKEIDWSKLEPVIRNYGNMGWPNYSELLYGTPHEQAVEEIILADLFARASFTAEEYDKAAMFHINWYNFCIGTFYGNTEEDFLNWCINSTNEKYSF